MNAPWKPGGPGNGRDPFLAFISDDATLDVARNVAVAMGWAPEKCNRGGLRDAVQTLAVSSSPIILLVDLSESVDPLNDINELAEVCEPGTLVVTLGQVNDVRLYRELIASGIQDYLVKPINANQLQETLTGVQAILTAPRPVEDGEQHKHWSMAVIGTRGGVGTTTIATSLAWNLSTACGRTTALLDLDLHFGTGALTLDLEPGRGLVDAIDNPGRIDGLFIERALTRSNDKLALLSAEAPLSNPLTCDGEAFQQLQAEFSQNFETTVIDMPRRMMVDYPQLLMTMEVIVLVVEMTLASARDSIRILSWLKSHAPAARIIIVANKVQTGASEISRTDFEKSIEKKLDFLIPYDCKTVIQAAKLGQAVTNSGEKSKIGSILGNIGAHCLSVADPDANDVKDKIGKPGLLGGLTSMFKSEKVEG